MPVLALWFYPVIFSLTELRQTGIPYSVWPSARILGYGEPFPLQGTEKDYSRRNGLFADGFDLARRVEKRF